MLSINPCENLNIDLKPIYVSSFTLFSAAKRKIIKLSFM